MARTELTRWRVRRYEWSLKRRNPITPTEGRGSAYCRLCVVYTTNRRVWEHDLVFLERLKAVTAIAIDMETATIFVVGHHNEISRGALLLVSDVPITPDGVKTEESDAQVTSDWADIHLQIGIDAMSHLGNHGEPIRHFRY